jgi:hypothetical protein
MPFLATMVISGLLEQMVVLALPVKIPIQKLAHLQLLV